MKTELRDDLSLRSLARELGYEIEMHVDDKYRGAKIDYADRANCPHFPLSFSLGDKRIWFCSRGWACADLVGNGHTDAITYKSHRYEPSLETVLRKEAKGGA